MRTTIGVLGVVGMGVSVALAQPPAAVRPRAATLLPATTPDPADLPPVARAVAEDLSTSTTPVLPPPGYPGIRPDPNVVPAGGISPATPVGSVIVPSVPTNDDGSPLGRGLDKIKGAFGGAAQAGAEQPNANSPYRSTTATGSTVYAGPPAYRWYGWGTVTPGANPNAPTGQFPKASANWYSITGATPGAFPVTVTNSNQLPAGPEPPTYATTPLPRTPNTLANAATPSRDLVRPSNSDPRLFSTTPTPPPAMVPQPTFVPPPGSTIASPNAVSSGVIAPPAPSASIYPVAPPGPAMPAVTAHADSTLSGMTSHLPPGPLLPLPQLPSGPGVTQPTPANASNTAAAPTAVPNTALPPIIVSPVGSPATPIVPLPPPSVLVPGEAKPSGANQLPPPLTMNGHLPPGPVPPDGPAPAALPVSVTDYQLKWQPSTDTQGQWNSPVKGESGPGFQGKSAGKVGVAPLAPAPASITPASAPSAQPATPMPAPDWQETGAADTSSPRPIARGQLGQSSPDPMVLLIQKLCSGRAEGVDVRYTGSKRLSVCFECHTAEDGKRLVKDISARPELVPYRIDFCVLVK